eukprot:CAMPEP_0172448836 /NCGR_PEP_ID=MMETSP1065-20121228/7759_1 /TAXON_ID=265537 /ORGANISM="Amphiprora paludosa, Strain CCMP125" /LENGTH=602 /DNA_ID=CAMNT_0013200425 /DNA_START=50 /DNA_END=1859 /DNA_ORIENTATION=-
MAPTSRLIRQSLRHVCRWGPIVRTDFRTIRLQQYPVMLVSTSRDLSSNAQQQQDGEERIPPSDSNDADSDQKPSFTKMFIADKKQHHATKVTTADIASKGLKQEQQSDSTRPITSQAPLDAPTGFGGGRSFFDNSIRARDQMIKMLHGIRKGDCHPHDDQTNAYIQEAIVNKFLSSQEMEIPPELAAKLISLSVQYFVLRAKVQGNLKRAEFLYWNLMNNSSRYLGEDIDTNSTIFCDTFASLAYQMNHPKHGVKVHEMATALQRVRMENKDRMNLTSYALNRMLKFYSNDRNVKECRKLLAYMIECWNNGDHSQAPNVVSFNLILQLYADLGRVDEATKLIHFMVDLYKKQQPTTLPCPNHLSIIHVLTAYTKRAHPDTGAKAEEFLRWALSCHEDGLADLSTIRLSSSMGRVLEAWSISDSPESGPRTDDLVQRIMDQYEHGGRIDEESPIPLHFASNLAAWVRSSKYPTNDEVSFDDSIRLVIQKMEEFGKQKNWVKESYWKFFWPTFRALEVARTSEQEHKLQALDLMHELLKCMERCGVPSGQIIKQFPILKEYVPKEFDSIRRIMGHSSNRLYSKWPRIEKAEDADAPLESMVLLE